MNRFRLAIKTTSTISAPDNLRPLLLLGWMMVMPLSFSSALGWLIYQNEAYINTLTTSQWMAVYATTILTMAFALTPTTIIALISGYFLGITAIFPLIITYSLASILGYSISKPLGKSFQSTLHKTYPKIDLLIHRMSNNSPIGFAFFCRISPVLPFAVMNVTLPFIGIKFKPFFWGGMAGMLPRTFLAIISGNLANDLFNLVKNPNSESYMPIGFGALLAVSIVGLVYLFKRKL